MIEKHLTRQITLEEMYSEVLREIAVRKSVYPRWVENGKISAATANFRILVLEALDVKLSHELRGNAAQKELF